MVQCTDSNEIARISIVNYNGNVLFDEYIKPKKKITNYLSWVSGITPSMVIKAKTMDFHGERV